MKLISNSGFCWFRSAGWVCRVDRCFLPELRRTGYLRMVESTWAGAVHDTSNQAVSVPSDAAVGGSGVPVLPGATSPQVVEEPLLDPLTVADSIVTGDQSPWPTVLHAAT